MKNIQKTNEICYCLGGEFETLGGEISPPKGPEKNTVGLAWPHPVPQGREGVW